MSQRAKTHYEVLLVHPDAPVEIIRASYRTLMQRLKAHPDLGGDHAAAAAINAAYGVLKDPAQRAAYDMELALSAGRVGSTMGVAGSAQSGVGVSSNRAGASGDRGACSCAFCGSVVRWNADATFGYARCARCASPLARVQLLEPQDGDPQRALYRIGKCEPVKIFLDWQDRLGQRGHLLDVSLTGLRFAAGVDLEEGQKVRIDSDLCAAVARIAHRGSAADGRGWQFGAEFLTVAFKRQRGSLLSTGV